MFIVHFNVARTQNQPALKAWVSLHPVLTTRECNMSFFVLTADCWNSAVHVGSDSTGAEQGCSVAYSESV